MEILKNVLGSEESSKALIVNVDTVYINSNVKEVTREFEDGKSYKEYQYDQIQMTKDEYIELLSSKNEKLNTELKNLMDLNLEKEGTIEKITSQLNNILETLLENNEENGDETNEEEN